MALDASNKLSRIAGPANAANGTSTIFTGTASHIYTIKAIRVVNNSAGAISFKIGIGGVADANLITATITLAAGDTFTDSDMQILSGVETLQINTTATGLTVTVYGLDQS